MACTLTVATVISNAAAPVAAKIHQEMDDRYEYCCNQVCMQNHAIGIIARSIRDRDIDDDLMQKMRKRGVAYVPTLYLDEFAYIYARQPEWIDDAFFKGESAAVTAPLKNGPLAGQLRALD